MEEKKYLCNFSMYTLRGQRVAIFGQQEGNGLKISVIACSRDDNFCKKEAREGFETGMILRSTKEGIKHELIHPIVEWVEIKEGDSSKYTFMKWCNEKYYKKMELGEFNVNFKEYYINLPTNKMYNKKGKLVEH